MSQHGVVQRIATHRCPKCGTVEQCPRLYFEEILDKDYRHTCEFCKHRWSEFD